MPSKITRNRFNNFLFSLGWLYFFITHFLTPYAIKMSLCIVGIIATVLSLTLEPIGFKEHAFQYLFLAQFILILAICVEFVIHKQKDLWETWAAITLAWFLYCMHWY